MTDAREELQAASNAARAERCGGIIVCSPEAIWDAAVKWCTEYGKADKLDGSSKSEEWIGVDLDGTLAYYDGWKGVDHIGDAIPTMLGRVKKWIKDGKRVKILTARATEPFAVPHIHKWLIDHGLPPLEVTNSKDYLMTECWDDRATQVFTNTGLPIQSALNNALRLLSRLANCELTEFTDDHLQTMQQTARAYIQRLQDSCCIPRTTDGNIPK